MLDIGQFSRLGRVSKRTLRYYDSIGLFKPIHADPDTGTRYYSAKQFADLNRILALKELGMSLVQIERMLADDVSQDEIRGMLLLKKAEVERGLLEEFQRFRSIEARLQNPDVYLTEGIVLKEVAEQPYLSYRKVMPAQTMGNLSFSLMKQLPSLIRKRKASNFMSIIHGDSFDEEQFDAELGFVIPKMSVEALVIDGDVQLTERLLPAVATMATIVLVGGPSAYPAGFSAVGRWNEANGFQVVGPQREIFLDVAPNPEDMVIEIQFPVERLLPSPKLLLSNSE